MEHQATQGRQGVAPMRKKYLFRFGFRIFVLAMAALLYFYRPRSFEVERGMGFFRGFSFLHVLWLLWMIDMVLQLIPTRDLFALGSQKHFSRHFIPIANRRSFEKLGEFIKESNYAVLKTAAAWIGLTCVIGLFRLTGFIGPKELVMISVVFYVCDVICVLFWCPFRVWLVKNKCCTTCRIFNWDHMMMFSPMLFIRGFYSWSLVLVSLVVLAAWEICFFTHPERFWEGTNAALTCHNCADKLCGGKLRPENAGLGSDCT